MSEIEASKKKKRRQLTFQMDSDLYEAFQKTAEENDRKMAFLLRDFIKGYIKKNKKTT